MRRALLALAATFLVCAAPAGAATFHPVDGVRATFALPDPTALALVTHEVLPLPEGPVQFGGGLAVVPGPDGLARAAVTAPLRYGFPIGSGIVRVPLGRQLPISIQTAGGWVFSSLETGRSVQVSDMQIFSFGSQHYVVGRIDGFGYGFAFLFNLDV